MTELNTDLKNEFKDKLKTKHRGEYALLFLREPQLDARLDVAIEYGVINDILDSAKHLAVLLSVGENSQYWKKTLEVQPADVSLLQKLTQIEEDGLDEAGKKALKVLTKTLLDQALILAARNFDGQSENKLKIPAGSIYHGLKETEATVTGGDPAEFGIYPKGQKYQSVVSAYAHSLKSFWRSVQQAPRATPDMKAPLSNYDLHTLVIDAASGDFTMYSAKSLKAIMLSDKPFSEVSRKQFASAFLQAAEQPRALGTFAFTALSTVSGAGREETIEKTQKFVQLAEIMWGLGEYHRGDFLLSAKEFTVGEFSSNPMTVEEIKALPFLVGLHQEVYAEVEHNHALVAESCAKKLNDAGYDIAAEIIIERHPEAKPAKPARKYEQDDGLGL